MKIATKKAEKPAVENTPASSSENLERQLPDKEFGLSSSLSEPIQSVDQMTFLIYGEKKIGKTSFASKFPRAHFLMFEPGYKGLRIHYKLMGEIETGEAWRNFKKYVDLFCKVQEHDFNTVVIDTISLAYNACLAYVCKINGMAHPSDEGYGKGWKMVASEFEVVMNKLAQSGLGILFLDHATEKEFNDRTGGKFDKIIPSMPNQAKNFVSGIADAIVYYGYYGNSRLLTIRGSDSVESGHRMEENFWIASETDKPLSERDKVNGRVHSIPAGDSSDESYNNFLAAFHNKQEGNGNPDEDTNYAVLSNKAVKMVSGKK